ncbi:MAG: hypothetical protein U1C58_02085 [Flavobacteriaceae bacterium]|nr:hypothetical protein [Flavobacteriaceae bacterium]
MIKQTTLDILDSQLRGKYDAYLKMDKEDRYGIFSRKPIRIDPWWSNLKYQEIKDEVVNLNWSKPIKYSDLVDFKTLITEEDKGIYLLYVQPTNLILELPRYLLYVGISGVNGSERPLRERLNDYLYPSQIDKRANIHKLLQMYFEEVYVVYSYYKGDFKRLEEIETSLTEFFSAPFSDAAYEPSTKKSQSIWK